MPNCTLNGLWGYTFILSKTWIERICRGIKKHLEVAESLLSFIYVIMFQILFKKTWLFKYINKYCLKYLVQTLYPTSHQCGKQSQTERQKERQREKHTACVETDTSNAQTFFPPPQSNRLKTLRPTGKPCFPACFTVGKTPKGGSITLLDQSSTPSGRGRGYTPLFPLTVAAPRSWFEEEV